jgi:hypothetical protein
VINALIETAQLDFTGAAPVAVAVPTDSGKSSDLSLRDLRDGGL